MLRDLETAMATWELPYRFGERPNVGILAAAATRLGYLPFEEYSAEKGRGKSRRKGRADFWLAAADGTRAFDFEAKYIEPSFRNKRLATTIKGHLDMASKDATDVRYKSDWTIGIVFLSPYGATCEDFSSDVFWNQLSDLGQYGGDFCAFHICAPEIWSRNDYYKDRPGIAIVGRYV